MPRLFEGTPFDIPPTCERCEELEEDCQCPEVIPPKKYVDPHLQKARIAVEKRKKGKVVTAISGLPAADNDLGFICTQLKNICGAGGTVDGDLIEIQGQHAQAASEFLASMGYQVKITNETVKKK